MSILREIEDVVMEAGFQSIIAYDFDISKEKTREYTLRLMYQFEYLFFEETSEGGQIVEIVTCSTHWTKF